MSQIKFSILTPTFNRQPFLVKLIRSMQNQSYKHFEWIVASDGSTDNTHSYLNQRIHDLNFPVKYIVSNKRIGKSMIDNILLDNAEGDYIVWCDSDDFLNNDTLESLNSIIQSNSSLNPEPIGVIGQNHDTNGVSQTFDISKPFPNDGTYLWSDIEEFVIGDGTICVKNEIYLNKRFPEVDFLTHEGILLKEIFNNHNFYLTKKVLKIMDRTAENSVTHGKMIEYARGSAFAMGKTIMIDNFKKFSLKQKIFCVLNYFRYSLHGDVKLKHIFTRWEVLKKFPIFNFILPLSIFICIRDRLLKKVVKTHIEFEKNKNTFSLMIKTNNNAR